MSQHPGGTTEQADPNTPVTILVIVLFAIFCLTCVYALQGFFEYREQREFERKVVAVQPKELVDSRKEDERRLESYRWIDEEQGVAAIPIEEAMRKTIEREGD